MYNIMLKAKKAFNVMVLLAIMLVINDSAHACDICGCSANGNYLGILPQYQYHTIGIRQLNRTFISTHKGLFGSDDEHTNEQFSTSELRGKWVVNEQWQLMAIVPVHQLKQSGASNKQVTGIGDVSLLVSRVIASTADTSANLWRHGLIAYTGLKVPTGKCDNVFTESSAYVPSMQLGTGSVDINVGVNYTARRLKFGTNVEFNYQKNGGNKLDYQFGDRVSSALRFFWCEGALRIKGAIIPQVGVQLDWAQKDYEQKSNQIINDLSGGYQLYQTTGLDVYSGSWSFQVCYALAIKQNFADGLIENTTNWRIGINYFISKKEK